MIQRNRITFSGVHMELVDEAERREMSKTWVVGKRKWEMR